MEPIFFHAKRVNARFLKLIDIATNPDSDALDRLKALDSISKTPKTHTFCVRNDEDTVRVTWAKVFKDEYDEKSDTFSKKEGTKVAREKMDRLIANPPRTIVSLESYIDDQNAENEEGDELVGVTPRQFLFDHLPACVADTLPWHIARAARYFKIDGNKPVIIEASEDKGAWASHRIQRKRIAITTTINALIELA